MKNIKIRAKMLIFSLTAAALIILVWALSIAQFENTKIGSKLYDEIMLSNELTADILPPPEYIIESYAIALEYIGTNDPIKRDELFASYQTLKETYQDRNAYWNERLTDSELRQVFLKESHDAAIRFFDVFENQVVPAAKSYNVLQKKPALINLRAAYTEHRAAIDNTLALADMWRTGILKTSEEMSRQGSLLLILIVACGILIGAVVSIAITHPLVSRTRYISGVLGSIADGDLTAKVDEKYISRDEIGQLCASTKRTAERLNGYLSYIREISSVLSTMAEGDMRISLAHDYSGEFAAIKRALLGISSAMNQTLSTIADASSQVNRGAKRISEGAQSLSQGVQTQASSIDELTTSIESVYEQAKENADNVKNATEYVEQAVRGIGQSNNSMHKMLASMSDISQTSSEISNIIKVIEDIAFQTNLLALNAAVEAARAGSAGSGFAVVAGEVRSLAGKSSEAARQTTELIEASIRAIAAGSQISLDTAGELEEVARKAGQIKTAIQNIDSASAAQAAAIKQIRQGLGQISAVVQSNAAASEESAAASEEMFSQSSLLNEEVAKFSLDGRGKSGAIPG